MPIHSIDYLNARKAMRPASGGTNYRKPVNPADLRARDAGMDAGELLHEQVRCVFADCRAWFAESSNALRSGLADDQPIPF